VRLGERLARGCRTDLSQPQPATLAANPRYRLRGFKDDRSRPTPTPHRERDFAYRANERIAVSIDFPAASVTHPNLIRAPRRIKLPARTLHR